MTPESAKNGDDLKYCNHVRDAAVQISTELLHDRSFLEKGILNYMQLAVIKWASLDSV